MYHEAFLFYQLQTMKKHRISLILLQLLASAIVMMAEAKTSGFEFRKMEKKSAEEVDPEAEVIQERDVFPDLLTFGTHFYQ